MNLPARYADTHPRSGVLDMSALFIITIGVWKAVTNASRAGVANIDKAYFDAAKILGASERQLIFRVAIPCAMPNIMAGMTQGMMTACTAIMVAEMMGVKAGLGWYITWVKSWALYNNMFASLIVICLIFTFVTKILNIVKKRVLLSQEHLSASLKSFSSTSLSAPSTHSQE